MLRKRRWAVARVLLLGMGNILMGDDGLGVHALRALEGRDLAGADRLELGTSLADCFSVLEGYEHIVALDAVVAGEKPGSLYWLSRDSFVRMRSGRLTLHDDDLLDALDLAALRGFRPTLHVAGMEPLCWQHWSLELSAPVRAAMPGYLESVCTRVRHLSEGGADISDRAFSYC